MARIETTEELRALYGAPSERAAHKEIEALDIHSRRFLSLSPFCLIGSSDGKGNADVTPRGDGPGFVQAYGDRTLLLPDRPGNRRLDTLSNILANPSVGMLFLIPGIDETMRVNGDAEIRDDADLLARFKVGEREPKTVMMVHIQSIFLHCPKAFIRSRLWDSQGWIRRSALPTFGEMLRAHSGLATSEESDEALIERMNNTLW